MALPKTSPAASFPAGDHTSAFEDPVIAEIVEEIRRLESCLGGAEDNPARFEQIIRLLHDLRNRLQARELRRQLLPGDTRVSMPPRS